MSSRIAGGSIALLCFLGLPGASVQSDALGDGRAPKEAPAVKRVVVKFRPGTPANERAALIRANRHVVDRTIPELDVHAVRIPRGKNAEQVIARYKNHPLVEYAEAEEYFPAALVPNDPWYSSTNMPLWHLHNPWVPGADIHAQDAWDITTGSPDIIIAILDTGVYGGHPDLISKMVPGWNVVRHNTDAHDFAGHGTAVAGQAAADSNNGIGVASPAWGCKIMPIVVTETGWTGSVELAEGTVWAADHGARIINMSFEGSQLSIMFDAARYVQERGGVVIQSAGNSGTFFSEPDNPYILVVSGTDLYDNICSFSVTGNNIDLAAPADSIGTTNDKGTYSFGTGTSAAAPIVSGVAALMLSVNRDLTGVQIQDILKQSADRPVPAPWDATRQCYWDTRYGCGRVNAAEAVRMAVSAGPPGPPPIDTTLPSVAIVAPTSGSLSGGMITILADASDNTSVAQVDLYVDNSFVSSDTVAPHEWAFDTKTRPNGAHTLTATAYDAAGNSAMSAGVSFTVDNSPPTASLIAPSNGATISGTVIVSGSASDNLGVERMEFYRDGNVLLGTDWSAPYSILWNSASTTGGTHTLLANAFDLAGNATASASRTVTVSGTVNITPLTVVISSPSSGATVSTKSTVTISAAASDSVGVSKVEFYVDGVLKGTDLTSAYTYAWKVPPQRGRTYGFLARAYDVNGNVASSGTVTVTSK